MHEVFATQSGKHILVENQENKEFSTLGILTSDINEFLTSFSRMKQILYSSERMDAVLV